MTNTTQATKCIAVATPFGTMYLELMENSEQYAFSGDDSVTDATYDKLTSTMNTMAAAFYAYNAEWISVVAYGSDPISFLPITSNYGNTFP